MIVLKPKLPDGYICNPERDFFVPIHSFKYFESMKRILLLEQECIYKNLVWKLKDKKVIEYGCGMGVGSNILNKHCDLLATDYNKTSIEFAKCLYQDIKFKDWDLKGSAYPEGFDVAIAIEVIEHVEAVEKVLLHLLQSAKEIYFSTPNRNNSDLGQDRPQNDYHVAEFTPQEIKDMMPNVHITILNPYTFMSLDVDTKTTPLVYYINQN